jgi:hypothetical protein
MANSEQLDTLKQGAKYWNHWRRCNPDEPIDLTGTDLTGINLTKVNLSEADLTGVNLTNAHLGGTTFFHTDLSGVQGLETCIHNADSHIDKGTVVRSGGLPVEFLRGCGFPESDIEISKIYNLELSESEIRETINNALELLVKERSVKGTK